MQMIYHMQWVEPTLEVRVFWKCLFDTDTNTNWAQSF
jgi:hypothetical protein